MKTEIFIFIFLLISSTFSAPITVDFSVVPKQESNLISFAEGHSFTVEYDNQALIGNICFGSANKCFDMQIDMNSLITWVPDSENQSKVSKKFDRSESRTCSTIRQDTFTFEDGRRMAGYVVSDRLQIGNFAVDGFNFVSASNTENFNYANGMLSLGYAIGSSSDGELSFLAQLYQKGMIKHKVISFDFISKSSGSLSIGKIPSKIVSDYQNYGTCTLEPDLNKEGQNNSVKRPWYCRIKGLVLGKNSVTDKVIQFSSRNAKFDFTTNKNLFPIANLLKMEKEYFKSQIDSGDCNFGIKNGYYTFTCAENNYSNLSDLTLMFENWGIHIPREDIFIFDKTDNEYEFIFYAKDGYDGFVIGTELMKKFTMVFDESNQNVGFYSQTDVVHLGNEPIVPPKTYDDGTLFPSNPDTPEKPPVLVDPSGPVIKPPFPDPGDKEDPFRPPIHIDPNPNPGETVIPTEETGFWGKFFKTFGILLLILAGIFIAWLGFRYYRRKKYSDPSYYYKVTDEMFNEGTPLE